MSQITIVYLQRANEVFYQNTCLFKTFLLSLQRAMDTITKNNNNINKIVITI